jgi:hypothetical protein
VPAGFRDGLLEPRAVVGLPPADPGVLMNRDELEAVGLSPRLDSAGLGCLQRTLASVRCCNGLRTADILRSCKMSNTF